MARPVPTTVVVAGLNPRIAYPNLCDSYKPLLAQYDWNVTIAFALMKSESGCNPVRDNSGLNTDGTNDVGLMQINSIHIGTLITDEQRRDPAQNVRAAYEIYRGALKRGDGFKPWSAYTNGSYLEDL